MACRCSQMACRSTPFAPSLSLSLPFRVCVCVCVCARARARASITALSSTWPPNTPHPQFPVASCVQ